MKKSVLLFVSLLLASWSAPQANRNQSNQDESQHPSKAHVTVEGCVGRSSSGHYTLERSGHSYALEARKIKFGQYLGRQVKVTGSESATLGTSLTSESAVGPAETIIVDSISTIAERCSH